MKAPNPFIIQPARPTQELTCPTCQRDLGELDNWLLCAQDCDPKYAGHHEDSLGGLNP